MKRLALLLFVLAALTGCTFPVCDYSEGHAACINPRD